MNQLLCHFLSLLPLSSSFPSSVSFISPPAEITVLPCFWMCNRWWDAVRIAVLWASLHHLKFWFAIERFTMRLKHKIIFLDPFTFLSSSIEICFRCTFYRFMKSINYLYCRLYPSRSSITNTATSEFIKVNFCSKILLQLRGVNPRKPGL